MGAKAHRCARATIEYDGTAFAGSQVQPNARTVQGELEEALNRLIGERIRIRLAGRTDAGVHATGQVAAFCFTRALPWKGGLPELRRRLNAVLPADLAVRALSWDRRIRSSAGRALARLSLPDPERGRRSRPLERHRTVEIEEPARRRRDARRRRPPLGERDFAPSVADAHGTTVRHLAEVRVLRHGNLVEVRVTANAFLRRMVRRIVAVLLEVGRGRLAPEAVDRAPGSSGVERSRTGSTGPRAHARARHLSISQTETERRTTNDAPTRARTKARPESGNVKTYAVKASEIERSWWVVDATDQTSAGWRRAIATLLEGKHKPIYSPHLDTGDHVVVLNAARSRSPETSCGRRATSATRTTPAACARRASEPPRAQARSSSSRSAVKGMLPQNRLGRAMFRKLKVYRGADHPHQAQQPTVSSCSREEDEP